MADLIIAGLLVGAAATGLRLGLVARLTSWVCMIALLVVAMRLLPVLGERFGAPGSPVAGLVSIGVAAAALGAGHAAGLGIAHRLWRVPRQRSGTGRRLDQAGGAVVGVAGMLALMWLVLPVVAGSPGPLSAAVSSSAAAQAIDRLLPEPPDAAQALRRFTADVPFPQVFDRLQATGDPGPPPPSSGLSADASNRVAASVLAVRAPACGRVQSGTAFVVAGAPAGITAMITNAHVVAGATGQVSVLAGDGSIRGADVVAFDPVNDLAVLLTEGVDLAPLTLNDAGAGEPTAGSNGAVFGYPGGGPLRIAPARVVRSIVASGRDIYGNAGARRDVLELAAELRPGDSGGPLVDAGGEVIGVVFAVATDRADVAYALGVPAARELLEAAGAGPSGWQAVTTGPCL